MEQEKNKLTLDLHAGEFEAFLYSPSDQFLGIVRNEIILLAFQCKVCESKKEGYYLVYEGKKYPITETGRVSNDFPPFHYLDDYLEYLLGF